MLKTKKRYKVRAHVELWPGEQGAWHFAHVEKKLSAEIQERHGMHKRGFGSLPVEVTLGKTKWKTSIFPERHSGTYLLPLKAAVRRAEGIAAGDTIAFVLKI